MNTDDKSVLHDGARNFFAGRNLMPGSESPVFDIHETTAIPKVGIAQVGVTLLTPPPSAAADIGTADSAVLSI